MSGTWLSRERLFTAWALTTSAVVLVAQALAGVYAEWGNVPGGAWALEIAFALPVLTGLMALLWRWVGGVWQGERSLAILGALAACGRWAWVASVHDRAREDFWGFAFVSDGLAATGGATVSGALLFAYAFPRVCERMPGALDGALERSPRAALAWALVALLAVLQLGRLSAFQADPSQRWAAAFPFHEMGIDHQCLPAYLLAAERARGGVDDVWAAPEAGSAPEPASGVVGMARYVDDPFLYPPPFLLFGRVALQFGEHYTTVRTFAFALNALVCLGAALFLARWIGGERGLAAGLALPLVVLSMPVALNLQFGQAHWATIAVAAVGAALAFSGSQRSGGLLLSVAIAAKIFPAVLLVPLAIRGSVRAVTWAVIGAALIAAGSLAVDGLGTWRTFVFEHLPRLADGSAVPFAREEPIAVVQSLAWVGWVDKLALLGVTLPEGTRPLVGRGAGLVLLVVAAVAAWRTAGRRDFAIRALALLALASLTGPFVPAAYGLTASIWLASVAFAEARGGGRRAAVLALVTFALLQGIPPLTGAPGALISLACSAFVAVGSTWLATRRSRDGTPAPG